MTITHRWENRRSVVTFDDPEEALKFVMDWRFGYSGPKRYDFKILKRWGLPRPGSAPDNMDLDEAIERGLVRLLDGVDK